MIQLNETHYFGYSTSQGYFFLVDGNNAKSFYRCRVEFSWQFRNRSFKRIGFLIDNVNKTKIQEFFNIITAKLGSKSQIIVHDTNYSNAVVISLPRFWVANDTVRSLFTLFLRCAAEYYQGNFEQALNDYHLTQKVIPTISHFLKGKTHPTYYKLTKKDGEGYFGFITEFENLNEQEISKKLI